MNGLRSFSFGVPWISALIWRAILLLLQIEFQVLGKLKFLLGDELKDLSIIGMIINTPIQN